MKLTNKEIQPYRIWYQYLQTALKDKKFSNKVDKNYYKDWHLNLVKKLTFNQWIKTHEHLFTQSDKSEIKLFEGKRTPNTLLVEIPVSFNVQRIQKEIGKAVKGKVAKAQTNQRFKIQEVWHKVNEKVIDRQKKVAKRVDKFRKTGKGIRQRQLTSGNPLKSEKNKEVLISRNISKAQNILSNVCKGVFPGEYSIQ